ncbi:hypothetical protein [Nonomuraea helvata]|uniref:Uncharacterized protein n=1 Tax=Nonomuraea helvata TaxID=37484 RepID=A0ABV5SGQ3_9ACTN
MALFYASFKRMATQPVVHLTEESYRERSAYEKGTGGYMWESGFDYRTKQWRVAWGSTRADDPITVCIDGRSYFYSYNLKKWQGPAADDIFCRQRNAYRFITDGLSTGGMTDAQAEAWIRDLQKDYKGFVNPGEPQLAEVKGRQYLRLVVDYRPVKRADGRYYGGQALMWSFKASGLDPQSHPYYYNGAMGTGYHVVHYIEPRSLMTAYSEVEQTPVLDESGRPREGGDWYKVRVEYHLPGKMPGMRATGKPARPKLTWPRDQA